MLGTRHRIRQRAGLALGPLSVSALLAFALFPVLADAEDSSGIQYSDAPPTLPGKNLREEPANTSNPGRGADAGDQSSTPPGSTDGGKAGDDSSAEDSGGAAAKGDGGGDRKGGSGATEKRGGDGSKPPKTLDAAPTSEEDAGSSPLAPILIALAVLAAISIGAVAMRRRRQGPDSGSPVSPEAS